jgi:di-N-acetylchitobiase
VESVKIDQRNNYTNNDCVCSDPSLCRPIGIPLYSRKEIYAFSLNASNWRYYDWSVITTMAHSFDNLSQEWICLAHQHKARVVFTTSIPVNILRNSTSNDQRQWAKKLVDRVDRLGGDGLNIDYESTIESDDYSTQNSLTYVTNQIQLFLKKQNPYSSLVFDFGWQPNIDVRYYQYQRLADICDYSFVMVYDTQSQVFDDPPGICLAHDNSAADSVRKSLQWYGGYSSNQQLPSSYNQSDEKLPSSYNIPYEKLILGLPWYGYVYNCSSFDTETKKCVIPSVPFRGANCSDAAGRQIDYPFTIAAIQKANAKEMFDPVTLTMKAFVHDQKTTLLTNERKSYHRHESGSVDGENVIAYYYDSPRSIQAKVSLAWKYTNGQLGGVGMWNADVPNYTDPEQGLSFWNAMVIPLPSPPSSQLQDQRR